MECVALHVPAGIGEPFFDSLESHLSSLMFSIPAVKSVSFGDGEMIDQCLVVKQMIVIIMMKMGM